MWTRTLKLWNYNAGELDQGTEIIAEYNCGKRRPAPGCGADDEGDDETININILLVLVYRI